MHDCLCRESVSPGCHNETVTPGSNSRLSTVSGRERIDMLLDEMSSADRPGGSSGAPSETQQAELNWHLSNETAFNSPLPSAFVLRLVNHPTLHQKSTCVSH
jgi:hypothetical protein